MIAAVKVEPLHSALQWKTNKKLTEHVLREAASYELLSVLPQ